MREFLTSIVILVVVAVAFSFKEGLLSLDERASLSGTPEFTTTPQGVDTELQKLLAEADASSGDGAKAAEVAAAEPTIAIGEELYNQNGANSCIYCHGAGGHDGNIANAAKLNQPETWKITKILGSGSVDSDKFKEAPRTK